MSPTSSSCVSLIHVSSHQRILNVNQLAGTIPSSFGSLITLRIVYVTRLLVPRWCLPISQRIKQATLWQSIERYHSSFLWLPLESSTTVCENHSIADLAERYVNIHSHLLLAIIHRDLSINQLSGTIPSSMLSLVNLQSLCVSTMQPRNYTPSLLVYSQHLFSYIHTNQLSGTIPSSIGSLARLTALYVNQSVSLVR